MTTPQQARAIADMLQTDIPAVAVNALRSLADQVEALTAQLDSYKKDAERMAYCLFGMLVERDRNSLTDDDRDMAGELIDRDLIFAGEEDYPIFDDMRRILRAAIAKGTA